jgi:hypothetical protein
MLTYRSGVRRVTGVRRDFARRAVDDRLHLDVDSHDPKDITSAGVLAAFVLGAPRG